MINSNAARPFPVVPEQRTGGDRTGPQRNHRLRILLVSPDRTTRLAWAHGMGAGGVGDTVLLNDADSTETATARLVGGPAPGLVMFDTRTTRRPPGPLLDLLSTAGPLSHVHLVVVGPAVSVAAVQQALKGGARGYLFGFPPPHAHLTEPADTAIRSGRNSHRDVTLSHQDPGSTGAVVRDIHGIEQHLSRREVGILRMVAEGESNAMIATAIGLSPLTVKSHLSRIARRLGTGDRAHLVLLALRAGAIT